MSKTIKHIGILTILIFTLYSGNAQEISFKGKIKGVDNAVINVTVIPLILGETPISDKINCNKGKFKCKIDLNLDTWHLIRLKSNVFGEILCKKRSCSDKLMNHDIIFFMQPQDQVVISAIPGEFGIKYDVRGNDISVQRSLACEKTFRFTEQLNYLKIQKENNPNASKKFDEQINHIQKQIDSTNLITIVQHSNWIYSAQLLAGYPVDTISKYYKSLSLKIQNTFFGKHVSKILNEATIGIPDPNSN